MPRHKQDWNELGEMDPLWAILSDPAGQYGGWQLDEFFDTGEHAVARLMARAEELGYPKRREMALDFGCGVGRLTRALATRFGHCYGVDISPSMIAQARELHTDIDNLTFTEISEESLSEFQNDTFDLICTFLVLQHVPTRAGIESYLAEFVRTLKPDGLLAFQLITHIPFRYRLQPGRRLYAILRNLGLNQRVLYERLGLTPIRMTYVPEEEIRTLLKSLKARILDVLVDESSEPSIHSRTFYATK